MPARTGPIGRDLLRQLGLAHASGIEVSGFDERGPAVRSGMHVGDIVVGVDDRPVANVDDIHCALQRWPTASALELRIVRERKLVDIQVMPVESPD